MRLPRNLAFAAAALLVVPISASASASASASPDASLPVSSLIDSANALLAQGDMHGAVAFFDTAIKKDPSNYLTRFKRGATYLSLGKSSQASADFDRVLELKPGFEAALLQRAKLKSQRGDWDSAKKDYSKVGRKRPEISEMDDAKKSITAAHKAEERKDWDICVEEAGKAIQVASQMSSLRSLRARCRLHNGDVLEAVSDLQGVIMLHPGDIDPHLQIANLLYFSLADFDRASAQLRKCLHSDPDSKPCSKALRSLKNYNKSLNKAREFREKRQWTSSNKLLIPQGDEDGVLKEVKAEVAELKHSGLLTAACPQDLLALISDLICDSFTQAGKKDKAAPYCDEALTYNPSSVPAALSKASRLISADLFEEAVRILRGIRSSVAGTEYAKRYRKLANEAETLLKRSKTKDYYKVLGVARDADDGEIKKAYRKLTKEFHPDKYRGELNADEVQTKMSQINEAYEVLGDPELRQRFDQGDDPNSQDGQSPFQNPFGGQQFVFQQGGFGGGQGGFPGGFKFGGEGGGFKFQF